MTSFSIYFYSLIFIHSHLFVQIKSSTNNSCPHLFKTLSHCICSHPQTIDCSYSTTLTDLPRSWRSTNHNLTWFTQSIRRFDLVSVSSLTTIRTDDFQGLPNLETLSIINTGLKVIQAHGFRHLTRLKHLRIESNRHLTELKSFALSNIHHIEHLSLRSNAIQKIHAEVFRNTYSVNVLDLSDNPLEIIESYAFTALHSVGSLILCVNARCSIKRIDFHAFFTLKNCDLIQLTGIQTEIHSKTFSHLSSIGLLNLSNSAINRIDSFAFEESQHIREIDLSSSMISALEQKAFYQLFNVSLLNLDSNFIRTLDKETFQPLIETIHRINLDNNPIQCDCSLEWYLIESRSNQFKVPEVCTGPIGYECLSPKHLQQSQLPCYYPNETFCDKRDKDLIHLKSNTNRLNSPMTLIYFLGFVLSSTKSLFLLDV